MTTSLHTFSDLIETYEYADLDILFTECYGDAYLSNSVKYEHIFEALKDSDKSLQSWLDVVLTDQVLSSWTSEEIIYNILGEIACSKRSFRYNIDSKFDGLIFSTLGAELSNTQFICGMDELEDIEDDKKGIELLKEILKYEIESSSSEDH